MNCSFCGKVEKEVKVLIQGPLVQICDECTGMCADIVKEFAEKKTFREMLRDAP